MYRIPCSRCAKQFKTESGLRWHLLHIHDCRDVEQLLREPPPETLARIALMREIGLQFFAKGIGYDVQDVLNLMKKHFPEYGGGPLSQVTVQYRPTVNTHEVQKPPWINPVVNMGEYWRNYRSRPPSQRGDESQKDQ